MKHFKNEGLFIIYFFTKRSDGIGPYPFTYEEKGNVLYQEETFHFRFRGCMQQKSGYSQFQMNARILNVRLTRIRTIGFIYPWD